MLMGVRNFLRGSLQVDLRGAAVERFLNLCSIHGVAFWDMRCLGVGWRLFEFASLCTQNRLQNPCDPKTRSAVRIKISGEAMGLVFVFHSEHHCGLLFICICLDH